MFTRQIANFAQNLDGLRSFVDLVAPFLDKKGRQTTKRHVKTLIPLILGFAKSNPKFLKETGFTEAELREFVKGDIKIESGRGDDKPSFSISVSGPQSRAVGAAISEIGAARQRILLLYQNSLISLISAVECFLSQIIHAYFGTVSEAVSGSDKVLSFDDLKNFNSVEDARTYLIEKKVAALMRRAFTDWIGFFRLKAGLSMSYLDPYMDTLVETYERRNLLVHNAGVVNTIYLSKVSSNLRKGKKKGSRLQVSRKYLDERIDYFEKYSLLIAAELWKKLKPRARKRGSVLAEVIYQHVLGGRWSVAEGLSYFLMNDKQMPEPLQLVATLNFWLSLKRQGKWEEIKEDVEQQDFTAKGLRFQLARLSLLERKDDFLKLAPRAIRGEDVRKEELLEFPIFEEMRSTRRFKELLGRSGKTATRKQEKSPKHTVGTRATAKRATTKRTTGRSQTASKK